MSGISLSRDATFDTAVRLAFDYNPNDSTKPDTVGFYPFADGIFNADFRDQDDYAYIGSALASSLGACQ